MVVNAIVCELNPLHRGHKFIFDSARECAGEESVVIAVMSGNFTQRCTPAIFDKYTRAEAAVKCGADLVVELPFPWCASGVENFARGGVGIAAGLGADRLVFGSESGSLDMLLRTAEVKDSPGFGEAVQKAEERGRGLGSAAIFDSVMKDFGINDPLGANDKLGGEYIRFGKRSGITEFTPIKRICDAKSATELRSMIFEDGLDSSREDIPQAAFDVFSSSEICREEKYRQILFSYCRLMLGDTDSDILTYAARAAAESGTADEFLRALPTKKYTAARLRREILHSLLGAEQSSDPPGFSVILAMNSRGRAYISDNKKKFELPLITKPADTDKLDRQSKKQYATHLRADGLYAMCMSRPASEYIKKHPHVL